MDSFENDTPQSPLPEDIGEVWPPPISSAAQSNLIVPFKTMVLRFVGSVSDFRTGHIEVSPDGVIIHGKTVLPAETQIPILIVTWFVLLFIPVCILFDLIRKDSILYLTWDQIHHVIIVPNKRQVCLVYDAVNHKGISKTYSLAFKLNPERYHAFTEAVSRLASAKLRATHLKEWKSPGIRVCDVGVCAMLLVIFGIVFFSRH